MTIDNKKLSADSVSVSAVHPQIDVTRAPLQQENQDIDRIIKRDTHKTREWLIVDVGCITLLWLFFTALVVLMVGFQFQGFKLSDTVMVAFLTTSLATVLGLLGIGLRFYFK